MKLTICHLYPDLLDLYGDRGNILTLAARSRWRGIETVLQKISLGEQPDYENMDILFIGGGSDREQRLLTEDLQKHERELRQAIADGLVLLAICGGYQLLGQYYQLTDGQRIPGLGILDLWTIAAEQRCIGNVVVRLAETLRAEMLEQAAAPGTAAPLDTLVGFENHSGQTYLGDGLRPLGKILTGHGNNGADGCEGMRYKNVFGTYLHGPLLPKNPHLADLLLALAWRRKGLDWEFPSLDDRWEKLAHTTIVKRVAPG
ncbi:MAG: glutamine amidotransferase [Peptococcaceae bacterium]|jgi:CobQ-like glutamine amidotransferase family enzyme|nr:glutamine amidotransferase [Peptococcaceae bacterium]